MGLSDLCRQGLYFHFSPANTLRVLTLCPDCARCCSCWVYQEHALFPALRELAIQLYLWAYFMLTAAPSTMHSMQLCLRNQERNHSVNEETEGQIRTVLFLFKQIRMGHLEGSVG